jgi:hypothetical protein
MKLLICYDNLISAFLLNKTVTANIRNLGGNNKNCLFRIRMLTICTP